MIKPTVFIGSSTEQIGTAEVLRDCLAPHARATVWNDPTAFDHNESVFGGLLKAAEQFDFAIFVFNADDEARIRESTVKMVRDNVLFEFGLFIGRIGRGRTFRISVQDAPATHIPTDLAGIVSLAFRKPADQQPDTVRAALASVCSRLVAEFEKQGRRNDHAIEELDINTARILCAASRQYTDPRFQEDIKRIQQRFSRATVRSLHGVDDEQLMNELASPARWDIIHLGIYVDPVTGDLIVPRAGTAPEEHNSERLRMGGIADLIQHSGAKLVVVVTCDSLVFAARLARLTNSIAGYKRIEAGPAIDWSGMFYRFLSEGCPLSEAFNRAQLYSDPGLLLLSKRDFRLVGVDPDSPNTGSVDSA